MPQTRIGDWAQQRGAELDRLYATEAREAGTRALGDAVPVLTREQLSVFSPEEWNAKKSKLTIDHWVRHARRQLGLPDRK
jgi:hypothetical protein